MAFGKRAPNQKGLTLIELLVGLAVTVLVSLIVYSFYQNWMGQMGRQKRVAALQANLREATQSINRYLVSGGLGGDSLFFDPHRLLSAPLIDGGHAVFESEKGGLTLTVYGNFSGEVTQVSEPMIFVSERGVKVDKPAVLKGYPYAYINAGSTQEVVQVSAVGADGKVSFTHDTWIPYPKGTLVFPLERVVVETEGKDQLQVRRETAAGKPVFVRRFNPSGNTGDSVFFRADKVDAMAGQIQYSLQFYARQGGLHSELLERKAEQTVLLRGF